MSYDQRLADAEAKVIEHDKAIAELHEKAEATIIALKARITALEAERDGWATAGVRIEGMLRKAEAERDEAKRHAAGQHRRVTELEAERDAAARNRDSWERDATDKWKRLQAAREALEAAKREADTMFVRPGVMTADLGAMARIGQICTRALKAMGTPGEAQGTTVFTGSEGHVTRNPTASSATPAAPMCPTCKGTRQISVPRYDGTPGVNVCPDCLGTATTPTPTEETTR